MKTKKFLALFLVAVLICTTVFAGCQKKDAEVATTEATTAPTEAATEAPTEAETEAPTEAETEAPTEAETEAPTEAETEAPTEAETEAPTEAEIEALAETEAETEAPAEAETEAPAEAETEAPAEAETEAPAEAETEAPAEAETEAPAVAAATVSVLDFEDGQIGFVTIYDGMANSASATVEVAEYNGSNAIKVTNNNGKVPYVAFDVVSLLGDKAADVAKVEMNMGIENPDGKFFACAGEMRLFTGGKLSGNARAWSVYMEKKNPKVAVFEMGNETFSAEAPAMVISLLTDNGIAKGAAPAVLYIDDVRFFDADGNVIEANPAASFAVEGFGGEADMTNLQYLGADAVELPGMACSGNAWGQNGVEMTEEFKAALVPGAVIEISYSSESGDIWLVLPWAEAGWTRVEQQTATTNLSHTTAQITFEQISAILGDDISKWGAMLQCESSGNWEVYAVKIGQPTGLKNLANKVEIPGFAVSGNAWGQDGVELSAELWEMMKPGAVVEINYSSESGDMWLVLPWAEAGWTRIEQQTAACNGSVCQISYEQIAAVLGDDTSKWGAMLQCESSGNWEVYAVSIASAELINTKANVEIPGFAVSGNAWGQDGIELNADQWAMMVPGAVITVQYESENGDLWLVLPWAEAGWTRIQQQTATCNGSVCQVTYEQIVEVLGDDVAKWGAMLQCEASGAWEVYSVCIGTAA